MTQDEKTIPDLVAERFSDIAARQGVEINIRHDGLVIWINVDGQCRSRIITNGFIPITVDDSRKPDVPPSME